MKGKGVLFVCLTPSSCLSGRIAGCFLLFHLTPDLLYFTGENTLHTYIHSVRA